MASRMRGKPHRAKIRSGVVWRYGGLLLLVWVVVVVAISDTS